MVTVDWIEESWKENTLLDEERALGTTTATCTEGLLLSNYRICSALKRLVQMPRDTTATAPDSYTWFRGILSLTLHTLRYFTVRLSGYCTWRSRDEPHAMTS